MPKFEVIKSKPLDEEIEEIQLSMFDIVEHEEEYWFHQMITNIENSKVLKKDE
jgi:hypothetical protein